MLGGLPGAVGAQTLQTFVARRGSENWSTRGLLPPASYGGGKAFNQGWTPDLAHAFTSVRSEEAAASEGKVGAAFVNQDTRKGLFEMVHSYTTVVESSSLVGASQDYSKVFFTNGSISGAAPLTPDTVPDARNFYAWDRESGTLSHAGQIPVGSASECGAGGPACVPAGSFIGGFTQPKHSVSADGNQAVFHGGSDSRLYARIDASSPNASTVEISASQRTDCAEDPDCGGDDVPDPQPDPFGKRPAGFQWATPSGSKVFFTSSEELTDDANTGPSIDTVARGIGRSNLDGTGKELNFLFPQSAIDVAVNGDHIYWVDTALDSIGRAKLNALGAPSEVELEYLVPGPVNFEVEVEVHGHPGEFAMEHVESESHPRFVDVEDGYIYWTNPSDPSSTGKPRDGHGTIGRAKIGLDGQPENVDPQFIIGAYNPQGIDVNDTHIYWANSWEAQNHRTIARAEVGGGNVQQAFRFITAQAVPYGVALSDTHVYWTEFEDSNQVGSVVRMPLEGGANDGSIGTGYRTRGLEVVGSHVYWAQERDGAIGRADLALTQASKEPQFISVPGAPTSVAADAGHLYWSVVLKGASAGNDLYAWDSSSHELTDLAPDPEHENGAEVVGVIGASDDGEYVYFVANADLDGPGGPAGPGDCVGSGFNYKGQCSLYLWHEGDPIEFIAPMEGEGGSGSTDATNWVSTPNVPGGGLESSTGRVSADGKTVLFRSVLQQTAYDNTPPDGSCGFQTGGTIPWPCPEFYRYDTEDGLTCVSCNPTGALPGGIPTVSTIDPPNLKPLSFSTVFPHTLSADGDRVFFETTDKLVGADTNGVKDVYQWEAQGSGSCDSTAQNGGCLYLLSTGASSGPSFFAGASASGNDVFFFTREALVPQDTDALIDVYDARVNGGLDAQHAVAPPGCAGEACRGQGTSAPQTPGSGTAVFQGQGNVKNEPRTTGRCPKGKRKVRRKGKARCVKRTRSQRRHRARNANSNRRAAR